MNNTPMQLTDGRWMRADWGSYSSSLYFIADSLEELSLKGGTIDSSELNLPTSRSLQFVMGTYCRSAKGRNLFTINPKGPHVLYMLRWGGNHDRGGDLDPLRPKALFIDRGSSNGGGQGIDYMVLPKECQYEMSVDNL